MEVKMSSWLVAVLLAALCVLANSLSLPSEVKQNDLDGGEKALGERATWLDTRGLEQDFKELVLMAIQELVAEERLAPIVDVEKPSKPMSKRGRWQGFCFRRTRSGRFLPYICWKGDRK